MHLPKICKCQQSCIRCFRRNALHKSIIQRTLPGRIHRLGRVRLRYLGEKAKWAGALDCHHNPAAALMFGAVQRSIGRF